MKEEEKSTRLFIISDLHLGGVSHPMMSRPWRLEAFLKALPGMVQENERPELVINGDFVDFLAVRPFAAWTPEPEAATKKLKNIISSQHFCPVFKALRELIAAGCPTTILLGNHDVELALPAVQQALLKELQARPHQVRLIDNGLPYRVGGVLIEHGNRYDGANANDWERLRLIASAQSRGEESPLALRTSFGSQFVEEHVNELKQFYPFVDLIQPQNELVALLLLAFEPMLGKDWSRICATRKAAKLTAENSEGKQPGRTYQIAASKIDDHPDEKLRTLFGQRYVELLDPSQGIALSDLWKAYRTNRKESLKELLLQKNAPVPSERLAQIRAQLCKVLLDDCSDRLNGPTEQYGLAADRLMNDVKGVKAVVMGHTHLPRIVETKKGWYVNTGTWIDRIRVPSEALEDGADEQLKAFLRDLLNDNRPDTTPMYADITLDSAGRISRLALEGYSQ
jgi:UDP-2,3-diacylglucosamine pyrophosphatase LpxH